MLKIIHILPRIAPGGGTQSPRNVVRHLQKDGFSHHTFVSLVPADPEVSAKLKKEGFGVVDAPKKLALLEIIDQADVVQIDWWNDPVLYNLLTSNWPAARIVIWSHISGSGGGHLITSDLVDWPDRFVVCTPSSLNLPAFDRKNAVFIHSPADLQRFGKVRRQAPGKTFCVGYVGSLDFSKIHSDFIDMSLMAGIADAHFLVAGDGRDAIEFANKVKASGKDYQFELFGRVKDPERVFLNSTIYGVPYAWNSFAAAEQNLQEALFFGLPCVVLSVGASSWLVQNEITGLVADSPESYAHSLRRLWLDDSLRRQMSQAAFNDANERFRSEKSASAFKHLYSDLMDMKKQNRPGLPVFPDPMLDDFKGAKVFITSMGEGGRRIFNEGHRHSWTLAESRMVERFFRFFPNDSFLRQWYAAARSQTSSAPIDELMFSVVGSEGCKKIDWMSISKPVWIWGAGESGKRARSILNHFGIQPQAFIDTDRLKYEKKMDGLSIYSPDVIEDPSAHQKFFLVLANHGAETIASALRKKGWAENDDFIILESALNPLAFHKEFGTSEEQELSL
jgi:glycosyltransferase involved in cell wall biosynthesis